jgi:hypothetical protein
MFDVGGKDHEKHTSKRISGAGTLASGLVASLRSVCREKPCNGRDPIGRKIVG